MVTPDIERLVRELARVPGNRLVAGNAVELGGDSDRWAALRSLPPAKRAAPLPESLDGCALPDAHARHFDRKGKIIFRRRRDSSRFRLAWREAPNSHHEVMARLKIKIKR